MKKDRKIAIRILGIFEDFLDNKDISIPSKDRKDLIGKNGTSEARIFGCEYYELEDAITNLLKRG